MSLPFSLYTAKRFFTGIIRVKAGYGLKKAKNKDEEKIGEDGRKAKDGSAI